MQRIREFAHSLLLPRNKTLFFLYGSQFLSSWGDRLWKFGVPFAIAKFFPGTLSPVALFSIVPLIAGFLLGSTVGYLVDRYARLVVVWCAMILQNSSVALSAVAVLSCHLLEPSPIPGVSIPFTNTASLLLFIAACIFSSVSQLASMARDVAVMRDWTVVVAVHHDLKLERINATMRRIDLFCDIFAPLAYSALQEFTGETVNVLVVAGWNVVSFFPEMLLLLVIYRTTPALALPRGTSTTEKPKQEQEQEQDRVQAPEQEVRDLELQDQASIQQQSLQEHQEYEVQQQDQAQENKQQRGGHEQLLSAEPPQETNANSIPSRAAGMLRSLVKGWLIYPKQIAFMPSISLVLLYITVLSHGSILITFLTWRNIPDIGIGIFRAVAALFGLIATLLSPVVISAWGNKRGGLLGIVFQWVCLTVGVAFLVTAFFWLHDQNWPLYVFLLFIMVSRVGLWSFDLAETQIMQTTVPEAHRGAVNAVESSLTKFAEGFILLLTIVLSNPAHFIYLALVSYSCVTLAMLCFTAWVAYSSGKLSEQGQPSAEPPTTMSDIVQDA